MKSKTIKLICVFVLMVVNSGIAQKENIENSDPKGISQQAITPKSSFQSIIPDLLSKWDIPGCAVALVKDERLVFAEGFGLSDRDNALPVTSKSLFRIGSLSKSIAAVTILKLVEDGLLNLDDKAFDIINDIQPPWWASVDPKLYNITIRNLLQHSGGWDIYLLGFGPLFMAREIAQVMGIPPPADAETIIRYMMGWPLNFAPGSRFAYSNFGYCILGRIVEKVTGENYEDYVSESILTPSGITKMRIGYSLLEDRAEDEVIYYDYPGAPYAQSVFSESVDYVPRPYGSFYMKAIDSAGAWIASAVDLMRFITSVDGHGVRPDILQPSSIKTMIARPNLPDWIGTDSYYAMGWEVQPVGDEAIWSHSGGIPGTLAWIVRSDDNLSWVALLNSRPYDDSFLIELNNSLIDAVYGITDWPNHDLFVQYNLTISSGSGGTTIPTPGIYTHYGGVEVTVEATPDAYYCLYGWGEAYQGNENPMVITMDANKNIFAHFRFIFEPIGLSSEKVLNRSLFQAEYINVLTWQANPKNSEITISKYKIFQINNGERNLVVELDSSIFKYWHRKVQENIIYTYEIVAINSDGREGRPARIVIE